MRFECEVILLYVRAVQAIMVKCTEALYIWDSYTLSILQAVNSIYIYICINVLRWLLYNEHSFSFISGN